MSVYDKVGEFKGIVQVWGSDWTWARFPSLESAQSFVAWLDANGYEHGGVCNEPEDNDISVRFR